MKLTKLMRDGFVARVMDDVPKIDYREKWAKRALEVAVAAMPGALQPVYALYPEYFRKWYAHCGPGFTAYLPNGDGSGPESRLRELIQADPMAKSFIDDSKAQNTAHDDIRTKLTGIAAACSTTQALLAALPELEKYIPADDTPTKNLPALANLVADLTLAGWPKEINAVS